MAEVGLFDQVYNPDVLTCIANLSSDEVFTPPDVANKMLDMLPQELFRNPDTKFLDPACKSGVFLREIAKRLITGLEPQFPDLQDRLDHIFHKQLYGIAITELTSLLSRRSLYCSKYPNSNYSVSKFNDAQGNVRFKKIQHTWKDGKCTYCGASQDQYDRSADLETHAYEWIHVKKPEDILKMKFDVIISNPPYQLSDGGAAASAKPIYQLFVSSALKLNPQYITMIIPARWYVGGKGLDSFRDTMLDDIHIRELHDFPKTDDCFPGVNIRGGVCYFLWDKSYNNTKSQVRVLTHEKNNVTNDIIRPMRIDQSEVFIRYDTAISILNKVKSFDEEVIVNQISPRKPFGIDGNIVTTEKFHSTKSYMRNPVKCYGKAGRIGYIDSSLIKSHLDWVNQWKVYMPYANNIGTELNDDNQNTFIGEPGSVCTETYILVGADLKLSEKEAFNLSQYLRTKFARFLLSLSKSSQHATAKTYRFVPIQNYAHLWTDEELYAKYGLTDDEISFIDSMIKPMDTTAGEDNA